MADQLPYMPFFPSDYALEAGHLTDEEHGAYIRLRILAWTSPGCRMPNDDEWLARRLARPIETVRTLYRRVLDELWKSDGNWLWRDDLKLAYERGKANSSARSVSAKARWNKEKGACKSNASKLKLNTKNLEPLTPETPTQQPSEPELPLAPSAPALPASKSKAQKPAYPPEFEQLWKAYPLRDEDKAAKADLAKIWRAQTKGHDHAQVLAAAQTMMRIDGANDYRRGLRSWLRNQAWTAPPPASAAHPRASPPIDPRLAARLAEANARKAARASAEAAGLNELDEQYDRHVGALMLEWYNNEQRRSA